MENAGLGATSVGPPSRLLRKWQWTDVIEAVEKAGLDPKACTLEDNGGEASVRNKGSYFTIRRDPAGRYVGRYVGGDSPERPFDKPWDLLVPLIAMWAGEVRRDIDTPDRFAELQQDARLLRGDFDTIGNSSFSPDERKELAARLHEYAETARQAHAFSKEQMRLLNGKIDDLVDAAGRLGRKDWLNVFVGTIFFYCLEVALPPDATREIFRGFVHVINRLYPLLSGG